jgi:hypothetical protein
MAVAFGQHCTHLSTPSFSTGQGGEMNQQFLDGEKETYILPLRARCPDRTRPSAEPESRCQQP